ncbi:MAG: prenyltransferase/squalene oxidase repeat-containing protein [Candidatus Brocadiia bacterium]
MALRRTFALTLLAALLCAPGPVTNARRPSAPRDLTPEATRAIERGLQWLARTQNPDGSWLSDGSTGRFPVAMTALCGLAMLAEGNTTYSGPRAESVRAAVRYLLAQSDPDTGLIGTAEAGRPMFGHGFSMLFLAQVYGSEGDTVLRERLRGVLEPAVSLTAAAQTERGGWYYTPESTEHEGAVTMVQLQGLRACANARLPVPQRTVRRAMDYVRASANPDGGIAYRVGQEGPSRPAITCAAVATMYAAGIYEGELVDGAIRFARRNVATTAPTPTGGTHFYYAHLYLSQVMYFRGGEEWSAYFPPLRDWLVGAQRADGSWQGEFIGRGYGTAVALMILQLPRNALPVLQR